MAHQRRLGLVGEWESRESKEEAVTSKMPKTLNSEGQRKTSVFSWMTPVFDCDCVCLAHLLTSIYYGSCLPRNACARHGKEIDKSVLHSGPRRDEVTFSWTVDVGSLTEGVSPADIGGNEADIISLEP